MEENKSMFLDKKKTMQKSSAFMKSNCFPQEKAIYKSDLFRRNGEGKEVENAESSTFQKKFSSAALSSANLKSNILKNKERKEEEEGNVNINTHEDAEEEANKNDELSRITRILKYKRPKLNKSLYITSKKREEEEDLPEDEVNGREFYTEGLSNCYDRHACMSKCTNDNNEEESYSKSFCMCNANEDKTKCNNEREIELMKALWRRQSNWRSVRIPMGRRFPKERKAFETSDDWMIFALHSQYVRPRREREWRHGDPAIIRRKYDFELPPGAVDYLVSSNSLPATAWDPFVFANSCRDLFCNRNYSSCLPLHSHPKPPRKLQGGFYAEDPFITTSDYLLKKNELEVEYGYNQLTKQDIINLERMIWMDPEPRFERPYRLYADSKYCLKGSKVVDVGFLMRPGW